MSLRAKKPIRNLTSRELRSSADLPLESHSVRQPAAAHPVQPQYRESGFRKPIDQPAGDEDVLHHQEQYTNHPKQQLYYVKQQPNHHRQFQQYPLERRPGQEGLRRADGLPQEKQQRDERA